MAEIQILEHPLSTPDVIEAGFMDVIVREGVFASGAFQYALPKLWSLETIGADHIPSATNPILRLAFAAPGTTAALGASHDAYVNLWCAFLPRVMNGSDWLRTWAKTQAFDIAAFRELPTPNGIMGDAVFLSQETGRLHRMLTVKDGDLVFLIDGSIDPKGDADNLWLQEFALIAASRFKLLAPSGTKYAEAMGEQSLKSSLGEAAFFLPQSWASEPTADVPSYGASAVFKHKRDEIVTGTLVASLGALDIKPEALEESLLAKLKPQGVRLDNAQLILEGTKGASKFSAHIRRGTTVDGQRVTLLCLRNITNSLPLSITLLSPAADTDFESWAINRRVFEIILESHAAGVV